MSRSGYAEDASALLYLVPFALSGIYGLVLWAQSGASLLLPTSVYLTVTRSPYVFVAGTLAILAGVVLETSEIDPQGRQQKLASVGKELQAVAVASLVLVVISAFYANGFLDVSGAASDFMAGRYGLVFPTLMIVLSYLITAKFNFGGLAQRRVLAMVVLLLVPASLYEVGKRSIMVGLAAAFLLLVAGAALLLIPEKKEAPKKE